MLDAIADFSSRGPSLFGVINHTWSSEPAGTYNWFMMLTAPGADPSNPANLLTVDTAPMQKK